ncbi:MAG: hypothetical protein ABFS30_14295 [Pseudomonadota bacterium]
MHLLYRQGIANDQVIVATVKLFTTEVFGGQILAPNGALHEPLLGLVGGAPPRA